LIFLSWSDIFYQLIVGAEGYCFTCSHSVGILWASDRPIAQNSTW